MKNDKVKLKKASILSFLIAVFIFSFLYLNLRDLHAQNVDLGVWPPLLRVMAQPGKTVTQVYKIKNFGDPVMVSSKMTSLSGTNDGDGLSMVDCEKVDVASCDSARWFSSDSGNISLGGSFYLGSDREEELTLKISVPDFAAEGDYYNSLLFTSQAPPQKSGKSSRITASVAANILLTVSESGTPKRTLKISRLKAEKSYSLFGFNFSLPLFDSFERVPVDLKVENLGNAYTEASGEIILEGFPGLRANYKITPQNLLAGSARTLLATPSAKITGSQTANRGKLNASLILPSSFYFGKYDLSVRIDNEDGTAIKEKTSFYALPLKFALITLLSVLIMVVIMKKIRQLKER